MDVPKAAVRSSVLAVVALLVTLVFVSVSQERSAAATAVTNRDGTPFKLTREEGVYPAAWGPQLEPVLVIVTRQAVLDGVERVRGDGQATPATSLGDGLAVFVVSAHSTYLGCTVGFNTGLGASKDVVDYDGDGQADGRMLDPCHHGQWDVFNRGRPQPGTPTGDARMALLRSELRADGSLVGTGFDGPTGPQR